MSGMKLTRVTYDYVRFATFIWM